MKYKSISKGKRQIRPNIYQLSRIMFYLEERGKLVKQTEISKDTLINWQYTKPALKWLSTHKLIDVKLIRQTKWYSRKK